MSAVNAAVADEIALLSGIASGEYETVTPGEYCTIEMAKQLQMNVADLAQEGIKSFTSSDTPDETYALCMANDSLATPHCGLELGPGYTKVDNKCVYNGCPAGFLDSGDACEKPSIQYQLTSSDRCDERWYDWFTVRDYHLGNGYANSSNGCLAPCPSGFVPDASQDGVDGSSKSLLGTGDPQKCIPIKGYFFGKYADSPPYCPLALVQQIITSTDPAIAQQQHIQTYEDFMANTLPNSEGFTSNVGVNIKAVADANAQTLVERVLSCQHQPDAILTSRPSTLVTQACGSLSSANPERLITPYKHCQQLYMNADAYKKSLPSGQMLTPDQWENYKKACDQVFCDENTVNHVKSVWSDADGDESKVGKLCFNNLKWSLAKKEETRESRLMKLYNWMKNPNNGEITLWYSFKLQVKLIILPMLFVVAYMFFVYVVLKRMVIPFLQFINRWFITGVKASGHESENATILAENNAAIKAAQLPKK